ncbi:hypothetical protein OSB04_010755 [Centaurea solstitialis]|uniref:Integrase catalytic domain-containing protein n=1 Tax=Centaurea solstitialis TaxID=347529 RepID=A0AA38TLC9_9ASTR|nr:hypothetical protein OSB04_010755 [Centaurea solstitialis]
MLVLVLNKLEQLYARKTRKNKLFLIKKLIQLKYHDGTPITDHLNAFQGIINQLAGMGIKFKDEIQGLWILGTLPDSWETFKTSLSNSSPDSVIAMELSKCRILNEDVRRKSQGSSSQSDVLVMESGKRSQSRDSSFICWDDEMVNLAHDHSSWVVDTGATCHVTSQRDLYSSYTQGNFGNVNVGNHGFSKIVGVEDVCLKFDTGMELVLWNVKHVLDMRLNVISTCLLDDNGYNNKFGDGIWNLTRGSLRWQEERKARSKHNRVLFKSHPPSRKENLHDLVHSDVCGPIETRTLGGCSYFVTFIDDHSRKTSWVEAQVYSKFRIDNGSEYIVPFDDYCREHGIRHQNSPPKTPQLNGLAEHMNRTLAKHVRCLLSHVGMPKSFWGEALNTEDVEKEDTSPQPNDDLIDLDPVPPKHVETHDGDGVQNDEQDGTDDTDILEQTEIDAEFHPELPVPDMPSFNLGGLVEIVILLHDTLLMNMSYSVMGESRSTRLDLWSKGFSQRKGIDIEEIFSRVMKMGSIRVILGLATTLDLEVEQMDLKTTFLHGDLDKEINMEQPQVVKSSLNRPNLFIISFLSKTCERFDDDDFIILLLYVDDMLIVGKNAERITQLKLELSKSFAIKDLGLAKQILGIWNTRDRASKKLHMSQKQYIEKVLQRFNMDKTKAVSSPLSTNFKLTNKDFPSSKNEIEEMDRILYASAVGSLMYAMGELCHGNQGCKNVLLYLLLRLKRFMQELGFMQQRFMVLCDNQSVIDLAKNTMFHKRTKHIDVRYHWIRDALEDKMFELDKVYTDDNGSDMLTKALACEKLKICCSITGMANSSS